MNHFRAALFAAAAIIATATPFAVGKALAQPSIEFGPGGVRVDPGFDRDRGIDREDARRIARREGGVREIDSIERRGDVWIVRGEDRSGDDVRVVINRRGGVVSVRRDED